MVVAVAASSVYKGFAYEDGNAFTNPGGTDTYMLVAARLTSGGDITSVTYDGVPLTALGNVGGLELWGLASPNSGTGLSLKVNPYNTDTRYVAVIVLTGVSSVGTVVTGTGTSSSSSLASITCPTDGLVYGATVFEYCGGGSVPTASAGTLIARYPDGSGGMKIAHSQSASTVALGWTGDYAPGFWRAIGVPVSATGGDTTAPVLTSATGTATGSTTATAGATTDEANGTMYAVVTTSTTQPSVAQIKAGQNDGGTTAAWSGSQAISSTGAKTFNATGLSASTTYYAHLVHTDAAANDSNRVSSASFTTNAPGVTPPVYLRAFRPAILNH